MILSCINNGKCQKKIETKKFSAFFFTSVLSKWFSKLTWTFYLRLWRFDFRKTWLTNILQNIRLLISSEVLFFLVILPLRFFLSPFQNPFFHKQWKVRKKSWKKQFQRFFLFSFDFSIFFSQNQSICFSNVFIVFFLSNTFQNKCSAPQKSNFQHFPWSTIA